MGEAIPTEGDHHHAVTWAPVSDPQRALLACSVFEVFFGGARGGGKTFGVLGEWAQHASQYGRDAVGLMVRRTAKQLGETFEAARSIYAPLGATFAGTPTSGGMRITMPGGARLTFGHLERDADAEQYQGFSLAHPRLRRGGRQLPVARPDLPPDGHAALGRRR